MSTDNPESKLKRYAFQPFEGAAAGKGESFMAQLSSEPIEQSKKLEEKFTSADLEKSRNEGYEKGFQEGLKAANEQRDKVAAEFDGKILELVQNIFGDLKKAEDEMVERSQKGWVKLSGLAVSIAKKIAGDALKQDPSAKIEETVKKCSALFSAGQSKITIYIHPTLLPKIKEKIDTVAAQHGFADKITLREDSTLSESGCRLEWKDGGMEIGSDAIWPEIEKIIQNS